MSITSRWLVCWSWFLQNRDNFMSLNFVQKGFWIALFVSKLGPWDDDKKKLENFSVQFMPFFRPDSNSTGKIMLFQKKIELNPTLFVVARTPQTLQKNRRKMTYTATIFDLLTCFGRFLTSIFLFSANFYAVWKKNVFDLVKKRRFYDG